MVNDVIDRLYGGLRYRLADDLNVTWSYLGKVANGRQTFGAELALHFAELSGLDADTVLIAAGHTEVADRLKRLYGRARVSRRILPLEQRHLLNSYLALSSDQQQAVRHLLMTFR